MNKDREYMKQKLIILVAFIALVLLLTACGADNEAERVDESGDTVERFAEANPADGESIGIPGYEKLTFRAGNKRQSVYLLNPANNAAYFVMTLMLDSGETIWKGKALYPGEVFTGITLIRPLDAGEYAAILHYDCFSVSNNEPLNGAEVELRLTVYEKD